MTNISLICLLKIRLAQYDEALVKLTNAEVQVEDLKLQLDDALGAEEMVVQLTERNLELGEVCLLANMAPFRFSLFFVENRGNAHYDRGSRGS